MADDWDDDEEPELDDLPEPDDWHPFALPATFEEWWEFDWESYDGEYEEFAVSADYEGD